MPLFLQATDVYNMLQRELPEDAYPQGAPASFFSTADMFSIAVQFEKLYTNLKSIYNNQWPQTCDDRIDDWEIKVFNQISPSPLTLLERQTRVLHQLQTHPGIAKQDMLNLVNYLIPAIGLSNMEIAEWQNESGAWLIGVSQLGVTTILNGARQNDITPGLWPGVDLCGAEISGNPGSIGQTADSLAEAQLESYTWELRIYNYTLSPSQYQTLDTALSAAEPGRSTHVITSGLTNADRINGST